jgi:integrase
MASIRKHARKDGTTAFYVLWREGGKQTSKPCEDESEARRLKAFLDANGQSLKLAAKAARSMRGDGPTVAQAVADHITGLTGVEDRTRADYTRDARLHINESIGSIKADKLTRRRVREWVNELDKTGASPKSIANWHGLLSAAMATAVEDGIRPDNPCRGVRLPEREHRNDKETFMELEHYQLLLSRFEAQWRPVVQLLAGTGLRWSEATALNVADVVLDAEVPYIVVDKAWKRTATNTFYIGKPKTRRAIRDVTIDA